MKKLLISISLLCMGMLCSCIDKNEAVDADSKPESLGGSIYDELQNANQDHLTGTFNTYLRLVNDITGYASTLSKTGSVTVFPANDEAFERFFQNNSWGVHRYEDLSDAQKKLLLKSSIIRNALLIDMLSNAYNGDNNPTANGMALRHKTSVSVIDSITHLYGAADMPRNNNWWTKFYPTGIDIVSDNTTPMMVHFTREQMVNNNITTTGSGSDFAILTGEPYDEATKPAYVFNDRIIHRDIICINGYIHQLKDVLVPPGNMAQVLRFSSETKIFSRILDYFAAPYYDPITTTNYNDWAIANGKPMKDSIFQMRYVSSRSQEAALVTDPNNNPLGQGRYLSFDPGWNGYYPAHANASSLQYDLTDMGAMFVPTDSAFMEYFRPGGNGAFLIDIYGDKPNTDANLMENLDAMQTKNPLVLTAFVKNLMKNSFVETVPSKFPTIINDASENMGMNIGYLKSTNGKYDIKIANNGVIYVLGKMLAPDEYRAVLAPSSSYADMYVMNWLVQDRQILKVDFRFYLLAMSANYAFFIPDDAAFDTYYIDPTSLGAAIGSARALHFYKFITNERTGDAELRCDVYDYNQTTHEIGKTVKETVNYKSATSAKYVTQLVDLLNYHTVLLKDNETLGTRHYYKTKQGGEIYVSGGNEGNYIASQPQLGSNALPAAVIKQDFPEANGHAYRIDHIIQPTQKSVFKTLEENSQFSEFFDFCSKFNTEDLLSWAGISHEKDPSYNFSEQDQYAIFSTSTLSNGQKNCLDENVKMFNTYNYTLYVPDNAAMEKAYAAGLPRWSDIQHDFDTYGDDATEEMKAADKYKIKVMREFARYHFQTVSLYADKTVDEGKYQTLASDALGNAHEVTISGGSDRMQLTDEAGISHVIDANSSLAVNLMARDYWFDSERTSANSIKTSSFCAIHEISTPLYIYTYKDANGKTVPTWNPTTVVLRAKRR